MNPPFPPFWLVLDVESVGLHGEAFAYGFVVVDKDGQTIDQRFGQCPPDAAAGTVDGREWVAANVRLHTRPVEYATPRELRDAFWAQWQQWRVQGAALAADCGWPVEAGFLASCVDDDPTRRSGAGPYPLHELSSIRLMAGFDPLETTERRPDELPAHDPLCDAKQSARLLVEALGKLPLEASSSSAPGPVESPPATTEQPPVEGPLPVDQPVESATPGPAEPTESAGPAVETSTSGEPEA